MKPIYQDVCQSEVSRQRNNQKWAMRAERDQIARFQNSKLSYQIFPCTRFGQFGRNYWRNLHIFRGPFSTHGDNNVGVGLHPLMTHVAWVSVIWQPSYSYFPTIPGSLDGCKLKPWRKIHNSRLLGHPIHAGRSPTGISLPLIFVIHRGLITPPCL